MVLHLRSQPFWLAAMLVGGVLWGAVGPSPAQSRIQRTDPRSIRLIDTSSTEEAGPEASSAGFWTFLDITSQAGVAMPDTLTESVAWGDYDRDGDPDLYFTNDGINRLFRNENGQAFTDVTAIAGVGDPGHGKGVAWADLDNDNDLDLFVVIEAPSRDLLYRNDGPVGQNNEFVFTNVSLSAGITDTSSIGGVVLLDFNRDGLLDIYISAAGDDILYKNLGDLQFLSVPLEFSADPDRIGAGAVAADFDQNGWIDIFASNRGDAPAQLFLNNGGTLTDSAEFRNIIAAGNGSGVVAFDADNDQDIDLYWSRWPGDGPRARSNEFYRNRGNGVFDEFATLTRLTDINGWALGAAVGDIDNDGMPDLFLANGGSPEGSPSVLFKNNPDQTFSEATGLLEGGIGNDARSAAFADFDNDGDLDLCVTGGLLSDTRLWRNDLGDASHWLDVRLTGRENNRSAIGTRVRVVAGSTDTVQEVSGGAGLGSQNALTLHFGLGQEDIVTSLKVTWPNGRFQSLTNISADQLIFIKEPAASPDLNGDGWIDGNDLLLLLADWGECFGCLADFNSDGFVNVPDLLALLNAFSAPTQGIGEVGVFPEPEAGWTNFQPSTDTRFVYVSASEGSDANDGLTSSTPKRTLAAGVLLLRDDMPDWLLLKRGDEWHEHLHNWRRSGRSADEPLLITGYGPGTARPRILSGSQTAFSIYSGDPVNHLAMIGLHLEADTYVGTGSRIVGVLILESGSNYLFEDMVIKGYTDNMVLQAGGPGLRNVVLRRSLILDSYRASEGIGKAQGLYVYGAHGLLVEECVFDHNGWSEVHPNATANIFNHNAYIDNGGSNVVFRRNIVSNASSHGLQLRPGGVIEDNLVVLNAIGILAGGGDNPTPGGTTATITGNVVLAGKDIGPNYERGFGIDLKNLIQGRVADNIVANKQSVIGGFFSIGKSVSGGPEGVGVNNTVVENNIVYNWRSPISFDSNCSSVIVRNNIVQDPALPDSMWLANTYTSNPAEVLFTNNTYYSPQANNDWFSMSWLSLPFAQWTTTVETDLVLDEIQFVDPSRTTLTYAAERGLPATHDALMQEIRLQSRSNWRVEYAIDALLDYFRTGFLPAGP